MPVEQVMLSLTITIYWLRVIQIKEIISTVNNYQTKLVWLNN